MMIETRCPECRRKLRWDVVPSSTEIRVHTCPAPNTRYRQAWTVKIKPAIEKRGVFYTPIEWIPRGNGGNAR